jgi:hypothetical protein
MARPDNQVLLPQPMHRQEIRRNISLSDSLSSPIELRQQCVSVCRAYSLQGSRLLIVFSASKSHGRLLLKLCSKSLDTSFW